MTVLAPDQVAAWEVTADRARAALRPPQGWPSAPRPLRVAILGWARLSLQAREGTGYNLSVSELAAGLAASGHQVYYLRSGIDYSIRPGMHIKPREFWRAVGCFDFINSPNLATANCNFRNIRSQINSAPQTAIVIEWLPRHPRPMSSTSTPSKPSALTSSPPCVPRDCPSSSPRTTTTGSAPRLTSSTMSARSARTTTGASAASAAFQPPSPPPKSAAAACARPAAASSAMAPPGKMGQVLDQFKRHVATMGNGHGIPIVEGGPTPNGAKLPAPSLPLHPSTRTNASSLARATSLSSTNTANARAAAVAALNSVDMVLAPSRLLLNVQKYKGVHEDNQPHVPHGQPHFDALTDAAKSSPFYGASPWCSATANRPLRLAYFGSTRYNKGLETLTRAIRELPADVRAKSHFVMRAAGDVTEFKHQLHNHPVSWLGGYDVSDLPGTLGEFDVGLLPTVGLENSPFVLLEHLHGGKFVIASRLGGPTDWIVENKNGLMFPAADIPQLAAAISRVVRGEVPIPSQRAIHEASTLQTYPAHVAAVMDAYQQVTQRPAACQS